MYKQTGFLEFRIENKIACQFIFTIGNARDINNLDVQ